MFITSDHPVTQMASTTEVLPNKKKRKRKQIASSPAVHADNEMSSNDKIISEIDRCKTAEESRKECAYKKSKDNDHFTKSEQRASSVRNYCGDVNSNLTEASPKKKSKKKKKDSAKNFSRGFNMSDDRLKAYGINPKKFKYTYLKKLHEDKRESIL